MKPRSIIEREVEKFVLNVTDSIESPECLVEAYKHARMLTETLGKAAFPHQDDIEVESKRHKIKQKGKVREHNLHNGRLQFIEKNHKLMAFIREKHLEGRRGPSIAREWNLPESMCARVCRYSKNHKMKLDQTIQDKVVELKLNGDSLQDIQTQVKLDILAVGEIVYIYRWQDILDQV